MSVRGWFTRNRDAAAGQSSLPNRPASSEFIGAGEPVKMTGTTTVGAEAAGALFAAHGMSDGGLLERTGQLVPEPGNAADPGAVAVHVEGSRVGYLPGHLANLLQLAPGQVLPCQVQLWAAPDRGRLRAVGWVAHGAGPFSWPHTGPNPPAITIAVQRTQQAGATTTMVDDALGGPDPARAAQFRRGLVGAHHYLETVDPIKQLKREGRLEGSVGAVLRRYRRRRARSGRARARPLVHRAGRDHPPQARRTRPGGGGLQRWLRACPVERRAGSKIQQRLDKLQLPG